jgi:uncharacterized protein with von Willebrand factor type A (vWA) domain
VNNEALKKELISALRALPMMKVYGQRFYLVRPRDLEEMIGSAIDAATRAAQRHHNRLSQEARVN